MAWQFQIQILSTLSPWPSPQIQAWCLESDFYPSSSDSSCIWAWCYLLLKFQVRYNIFLSFLTSYQDINDRFCQISPFGHDTIWKFTNNVSRMKKLAARDFEDLLQVWEHVVFHFKDTHRHTSAPSQPLRAYCPSNITGLFRNFSLI